MPHDQRLPVALLSLRLGVFVVMLFWTLDKFINPDHAGAVFANFYLLEGMTAALLAVVGAVEMLLIIAFLLGLWKRWTYTAVFVLHGISTLSSYAQYLEPFDNLLFFAAWPMWAATFALVLLRDEDTLWTLGGAPLPPAAADE